MNYSINSFVKLDGEFIPIADVRAPLQNGRYIDGAMVWKIGSETLLTEYHWDLVDQLWAYIVSGACELKQCRESKTYFPDQALELIFEKLDDNTVSVIVGHDRHIVPYDLFVQSVADGGREFFTRMYALVPEGKPTWDLYLSKIDQLCVSDR